MSYSHAAPSGRLPQVSPSAVDSSDLRAEVRDFLARTSFEPRIDPMVDGYDPEFSRALGQQGWIGMTIPVEYGGGGRTAIDRYAVVEELLAAGAPISAHWTADRQVAPNLARFGNEQLKARYLPAIASGTCHFAIGLSEPDAGSDLAGIRTRAMRVDGGWSLSGTKVWTTMAPHAHAILVLARTSAPSTSDRREGLSQLVVPLPSEGVTIRPIQGLAGRAHFGEVIFDNVFVPDDMVLGEVGQGWAQATAELALERSGPDRFLSVFPLFNQVSGRTRGALIGRLWALRQGSLSVNAAIASGDTPAVEAVMVKDLGTQFELELLEAALETASDEVDPAGSPGGRELAAAVLASPTFTLRGGSSEILRGIVAKDLGVR